MILKRIAAICFALAFLMAIVLFTGTGSQYIPRLIAKFIFLAAGASGLMLNLLSFRFGKHDISFNFFYWLGSIVLFIGLTFMILHWPYGMYLVMGGMAIVGLSFFVNPKIMNDDAKNEDLLDN